MNALSKRVPFCGMTGTQLGSDLTVTLRRSLGRRLTAIRTARKLKTTDLPTVGSRNKIGRLENGEGPFRPADIREFCRICGVDRDETEQLVELAARTKETRIWDDYSDLLPGSFGTLVDLEVAADRISTWEPDVMPGLLQTLDYARAVFHATRPPISEEQVERLAAVRAQRQNGVLSGPRKTQISAVLNEAVLAREVGGPEVTAQQINHLRRLNEGARMQIRVLTFKSGAHAAMRGSFSILQFPDPEEPTVAYVEGPAGARLVNRPGHVAEYLEQLDSLIEQSIPLEEYLS